MARRSGRNRWRRRRLHWRWRLRRRARRFSYNWQLLHFAATPFGIALTTIATTHLRYPTVRPAIANFDGMASLVSIGAVYYGMIAVVAELGGRTVFWALAQWQKDREAARREQRRRNARARAAGLAQGIEQGIEQGIAQGIEQGIEQGIGQGIEQGQRGIILRMWGSAQSDEERSRIQRIADEHGIPLPSQDQ